MKIICVVYPVSTLAVEMRFMHVEKKGRISTSKYWSGMYEPSPPQYTSAKVCNKHQKTANSKGNKLQNTTQCHTGITFGLPAHHTAAFIENNTFHRNGARAHLHKEQQVTSDHKRVQLFQCNGIT